MKEEMKGIKEGGSYVRRKSVKIKEALRVTGKDTKIIKEETKYIKEDKGVSREDVKAQVKGIIEDMRVTTDDIKCIKKKQKKKRKQAFFNSSVVNPEILVTGEYYLFDFCYSFRIFNQIITLNIFFS